MKKVSFTLLLCFFALTFLTNTLLANGEITVETANALICRGDSTLLNAVDANGNAVDVQWFELNSTDMIGDASSNVMVNPITTTSYYALLVLADCTLRDTIEITVDATIVNLKAKDFCNGEAVDIELTIPNDAPNINSYSWTLNGQVIDPLTNVSHSYITACETDILRVSLVSENACVYTDSLLIEGSNPNIEIANAFTPNNDKTNDFFTVKCNAPVKSFQVFNRWGQIVYNNDTPTTGWDGRFNGADAPSDVYIYQIEVENTCTDIIRGDITLLR